MKDYSLFFNSAIKILGWSGGTIHQVLDVLRNARLVAEMRANDETDEIHKALNALERSIFNKW